MAELYDASDELIPSVHDFDATLDEFDKAETIYELGDVADNHLTTIQFALRFTKAALSGEVSSGMYREGAGKQGYRKPLHQGMRPASSQYDEAERLRNAFKAMCAELAKEVGNG